MKIYIHQEEQFMDMNGRMGIKVCFLLLFNQLMILTQTLPGSKIQMQINWQQVKMLDQSVKSQDSGYRCDGSISYDTCMYTAVTKVTIVDYLVHI